MDQNIYRNIEYDTWSEHRKEQRLNTWYFSNNHFKVNFLFLYSNVENVKKKNFSFNIGWYQMFGKNT